MRSGCKPASTSRPPTTPATAGEDPALGLAQQDSFINVALGGVDPETGGLSAQRRGGSQLDVPNQRQQLRRRVQQAATREASRLHRRPRHRSDGPGDHFLGTENPNIVIGFDTTGSHNVGQDIPLDPGSRPVEEQSGSTYHVGIGRNGWQQPTQTLIGSYSGYATGMVQSEVPATSISRTWWRAPRPTTSRSTSTRLPTRSAAASPCATSPVMTAPPKPIFSDSATREIRRTARPISTTSTTPQSKVSPGPR